MYNFNGKTALVTGAGRVQIIEHYTSWLQKVRLELSRHILMGYSLSGDDHLWLQKEIAELICIHDIYENTSFIGIGREIVKELSKYGAQVIALSRTRENLESLKTEIPSVEIVCVDLADWKATRQAVEKLGIIELLVNNAGILEEAVFETITEEQFDKTFNVNVKPIINISQVIVKKLKDSQKTGSIVNISSVSSWFNYSGEGVYGLSKATIDKLTKLMAKELGPFGIRVNSVNPSWVMTEMAMQILNPENEIELKRRIPLGKFCNVRNISDAVLFLLSDKSEMVNGIHFSIDGGEQ